METGAVHSPRWLALAVVATIMVIDIIDLTIVNVAIPTLQRSFGAGDSAAQWLVAGYSTLFAVLIASGGRLGDIYGYRRVMLIGIVGFVATSMLCGFAPDPTWLVLGRLLQGVAAAIMLPQVGSFVQILYRPEERVAALGTFGILGGMAAVAGPILGGLLIDANLFGLSWRPIFLINLPIGALAFAAGWTILPDTRSPHPLRIDVPGTILSIAFLGAVMVPLVQGRALGWPWWSLALLVAAPVLLVAMIIYSRQRMARDGSALLMPDLFRERSFSVGLCLASLFQMAMAGLLFTLTLALQNGLGFSPRTVGLVHAPFAVGVAAGIGLISRRAIPRFGARLVPAGAAVMGAGLIGLVVLLSHDRPDMILLCVAMAAMGLGMGTLSGPLQPIALSEVDTGHAGVASGTLRSIQEVGGAAGVALVGGVFLSRAAIHGALDAFAWSSIALLALLAAVAFGTVFVPRNLRALSGGKP